MVTEFITWLSTQKPEDIFVLGIIIGGLAVWNFKD